MEALMKVIYFLGDNKVLTTIIVLCGMVTVGISRGTLFNFKKGE